MNIVLFDDLPEGGAKRVVFEQAKRLSLKHQVFWITNTVRSRFSFEKYVQHVYRFDLSLVEEKSWKRPIKELSYYYKIIPTLLKISHLINQINPDVVIAHPSLLTQAPSILQYVKYPTIYFAEEWFRLLYEPGIHPLPKSKLHAFYENARRLWLKRIDKDSVHRATHVLTTSAYNQQSIQKAYSVEPSVIPLGVDLDIFKPASPSLEKKYFLFIGEKESINGYPLLERIKQLRLHSYPIKYIGFKNKTEFAYSDFQLAKIYQGAYATLCLAVDEPFGLVALESMACGVPVIAVDEAGYKETVVHRRTGLLIKRDPVELANAMDQLKKNEKLRTRLGLNGRKRVTDHFGWDLHVRRLEKIIWELVS